MVLDEDAARQLAQTLYTELDDLKGVLRKRYPYVAGREFTPKRVNRSLGYVAGAPCTKLVESLQPVEITSHGND